MLKKFVAFALFLFVCASGYTQEIEVRKAGEFFGFSLDSGHLSAQKCQRDYPEMRNSWGVVCNNYEESVKVAILYRKKTTQKVAMQRGMIGIVTNARERIGVPHKGTYNCFDDNDTPLIKHVEGLIISKTKCKLSIEDGTTINFSFLWVSSKEMLVKKEVGAVFVAFSAAPEEEVYRKMRKIEGDISIATPD